jgi:hypothetical protein
MVGLYSYNRTMCKMFLCCFGYSDCKPTPTLYDPSVIEETLNPISLAHLCIWLATIRGLTSHSLRKVSRLVSNPRVIIGVLLRE